MKAPVVTVLTLAFMAAWGVGVYWLAFHFFGWLGIAVLVALGVLGTLRRIPPLVRALRAYRREARGGAR